MDARRLHRRIMSVLGVLLLYWAASGLLVATFDLRDPQQGWAVMGGGPGARSVLDTRLLAPVPEPRLLAPGMAAAFADAAHMPVASVDLRVVRGQARLQLAEANGERDRMRRYYAASGAPMDQEQAEDLAAAFPRMRAHEQIQAWHKGDAAGLPGQVLGLAAGLTLAAMLATGLTVYLRLHAARSRARHGGVFWKIPRESTWRRVHRWVAIVAAAFLANTAITGLVLESGEMLVQLAVRYHIGRPPYPLPTPMPPESQGALAGDLGAALQSTWEAGTALGQGRAVVAVQLLVRDGRQLGVATTAGADGQAFAFDMRGQRVHDGVDYGIQHGNGYFTDWHQVVKRMHRGDIVGLKAGRYIAILNGLALLYLVVSGFVMHLQLGRRKG